MICTFKNQPWGTSRRLRHLIIASASLAFSLAAHASPVTLGAVGSSAVGGSTAATNPQAGTLAGASLLTDVGGSDAQAGATAVPAPPTDFLFRSGYERAGTSRTGGSGALKRCCCWARGCWDWLVWAGVAFADDEVVPWGAAVFRRGLPLRVPLRESLPSPRGGVATSGDQGLLGEAEELHCDDGDVILLPVALCLGGDLLGAFPAEYTRAIEAQQLAFRVGRPRGRVRRSREGQDRRQEYERLRERSSSQGEPRTGSAKTSRAKQHTPTGEVRRAQRV